MATDITPDERRLLEQVSDAIRTRRLNQGAALAEQALAGGLRHPLLFNARGLWLSEIGRHREALEAMAQARALAPPSAAIESAIGQCLMKLDRPDDAAQAFAAAAALDPASPVLLSRLAWAREAAGDLAGAETAYRGALALKPDIPDALGRLAFLRARRGDLAAATELAARCLALQPRNPAAQLALASAELRSGAHDAAETRLNAFLNDVHPGSTDRYLALSLLADVFDARNDTDNAFGAYSAANEDFARVHAVRFGGARLLDTVASLEAYLSDHPEAARFPAAASDAPSHIFLIGFLRSGTTLMEQILASHPAVATLEERDTLADAVRAFLAEPEDLAKLARAGEEEKAQFRARYWQRVRHFGVEPKGKVFVDKTPINTIKLPLIAGLFPSAKILFALRDPRDVVLSCFRRPFGINPTTYELLELERAARFYDAVMRLYVLYRHRLALDLFELRHEALVADFEGQMRAVCAFIGIAWDDAMRDFAEQSKSRPITTPSAAQVAQGLNREGIGQWRRYARQMAPVLPILKPWVEHFGYPPD